MIELIREKYDEARSDTITMKSVSEDQTSYPPHSIDYYVYPKLRYKQIVRKEADRSVLDHSSYRGVWKHFESYRIYSSSSALHGMRYANQKWGFWPSSHYISQGQISDTSVGYYYWTPIIGGPHEPFGTAGTLNLPTTVSGKQLCNPFIMDESRGKIIPPPDLLDSLQARALRQMLPTIKKELSALNSFYELKDFGFLPNSLKRLAKATKLVTFIKPFLKNSLTLREISRKSASGFLTWKFAIAPLISDISSIHAAVTGYKRRINDLVTRTGGRQTRHFTYVWREYDNSDEVVETGYALPETGVSSNLVPLDCRRRIYYDSSTFHAEVQYNYNYTAYQTRHAETLALLDALGVNFNPRIIWDALPFSFVVDWVLKVGNLLDTVGVQHMEPRINIHQYLWSIKRRRRIVVDHGRSSVQATALNGYIDKQRTSLPMVTESSYGRFIDYPLVPSLVETSGLNSSEFTLGAALVIAQRRRRH